MANLLGVLGCGLGAGAVALIAALVTSERVRRKGLVGTVRDEFSTTQHLKSPYRG